MRRELLDVEDLNRLILNRALEPANVLNGLNDLNLLNKFVRLSA